MFSVTRGEIIAKSKMSTAGYYKGRDGGNGFDPEDETWAVINGTR